VRPVYRGGYLPVAAAVSDQIVRVLGMRLAELVLVIATGCGKPGNPPAPELADVLDPVGEHQHRRAVTLATQNLTSAQPVDAGVITSTTRWYSSRSRS
jgi:hypothetical protein